MTLTGVYTRPSAMRSGPIRLLHVAALALGLGLVWSLALTTVSAATKTAVVPKVAPKPFVVAIAPGHGGYDPGAVSPFNGLQEKKVTLSVGLDLRQLLEQQGVKVVMSRTTDVYVSISRMEAVAVDNHANLFVSLWVNDWTTSTLEGVTVFTPHSVDDPFAQAVDAALGRAVAPFGMGNRGVQPLSRLWVHAPMPTLTIESGFMSNRQDSLLLAQPRFREALAQGIYNGILAYAPQITTIHQQQMAFAAARQRQLAAARLAAARGRQASTMVSWAILIVVTAVLLFLALYRDLLGRSLRWSFNRARSEVGSRLTESLESRPRAVRRPAPGAQAHPLRARPAPKRTSHSTPGRAGLAAQVLAWLRPAPRPRRPPVARPPATGRRGWRTEGLGTRPQRVAGMVHEDDWGSRRRERRSVYDDLSL